ncbi:hypothetical protein J2T17_007483 [Paenibacillus mucilaginosus]
MKADRLFKREAAANQEGENRCPYDGVRDLSIDTLDGRFVDVMMEKQLLL